MPENNQEYDVKANKKLIFITLTFALLLIVGTIIFEQGTPNSIKKSSFTEDTYQHFPMLGTGKATVRMLEFADFKCTFCKKWNSDIFPLLKKDYIDTGKVDFFFGNMPILADDSFTAALAAVSVYKQNPDIFWSYQRLLYENMVDEHFNWNRDLLAQIAKNNGLLIDLDQLKSDIDNQTYKEDVFFQKMIGQNAGISRVPSLYLNGKPISGDYEDLKKMIELELQKERK